MGEALEFLRRLRPGGPWQLVAINPDRTGPMRGCRAVTAEQARQFIAANQRRNLYYHVNRCYRMAGVKASKDDISDIEFMHADLDPTSGESPSDAKKRYLAALRATNLPTPSFLVDSGGGIQALWRIEPIEVTDSTSPVVLRIEGISRAVMAMLRSSAGTQDVSRLLRLPATTNWPNAAKRRAGRTPCMAKLISASEGVHSLDAFPQPALTPVRARRSAPATTGVVGGVEVDPLAHDWREVVEKYRASPDARGRRRSMAHVKMMMAAQMVSGPYKRSTMIFKIAAELRDAGMTWSEIASVVWRSPYFTDKHGQNSKRLTSELRRIEDYLESKGRK
jgi:hypothetical protein